MMQRLFSFITMLAIVFGFSYAAQAQGYPGAGLFRYRCEAAGITFYTQTGEASYVTKAQLASALSAAAGGSNQLVSQGAQISVWALTSNEIQVHEIYDPDATKMVWPSGICGAIFAAPAQQSEVIAYAQTLGPYQSIAYTRVIGQGTGYAQVSPSGQVTAYANVPAPVTQPAAAVQPGQQIHIVRAGENLFRISLRYGTTIQRLMLLNGLSNPNWIYAGQRLIIG